MAVARRFLRAKEEALMLCYSTLHHNLEQPRRSKPDRNITPKWSETGPSLRTRTLKVGLCPPISRALHRRYEIKFNKISIKVKTCILRTCLSKYMLHRHPSSNSSSKTINHVASEVADSSKSKTVTVKISSKVMRIPMVDLLSLSTSIRI